MFLYSNLVKYFKRKLVSYSFPQRNNYRGDLADIDRALIYFCSNVGLDFTRYGLYLNSIIYSAMANDSNNPYSFYRYNYALHKKSPDYTFFIIKLWAVNVNVGNYTVFCDFLKNFNRNDDFSRTVMALVQEAFKEVYIVKYGFYRASLQSLYRSTSRAWMTSRPGDINDHLDIELDRLYSDINSYKDIYEGRLRTLRDRELRRREQEHQRARQLDEERLRRQAIIEREAEMERLRNRMSRLTILGLTASDDSVDKIKTAYRKLAKECHPDIGGTGERFIEITQAYEYLTN